MLGCFLWHETPSYEVLRRQKKKKISSFISTSEFQWILIRMKKDASSEMTNNNLTTCQNAIPLLRGKYFPSRTDQRHHLCDKIAMVHFIERMDLSQQRRTVDILLIHIP